MASEFDDAMRLRSSNMEDQSLDQAERDHIYESMRTVIQDAIAYLAHTPSHYQRRVLAPVPVKFTGAKGTTGIPQVGWALGDGYSDFSSSELGPWKRTTHFVEWALYDDLSWQYQGTVVSGKKRGVPAGIAAADVRMLETAHTSAQRQAYVTHALRRPSPIPRGSPHGLVEPMRYEQWGLWNGDTVSRRFRIFEFEPNGERLFTGEVRDESFAHFFAALVERTLRSF